MRKVTAKKLLKLIKESGFKVIYNLKDKEYKFIEDYGLLYKNERLVK